MKYCRNCILPDTRPNLIIESDGICNACHNAAVKIQQIDWQKREAEFGKVAEHAKDRSKGYDCLIPVSGGKDSTWQVVKCLEYGMNPLAVTWKTPARTQVGQANLDNLVRLGVDHIDYQINPRVESVFMLKALERFGSTAIPMHMALFNIPLKIALRFDIPLVVWGENSAVEYGSVADVVHGFKLDSPWLKQFGVTHGTTAKDWISSHLTEKDLTPYFGPTDPELEEKGVHAIFLGYYFHWDPQESLRTALQKGFRIREEGPKTGLYDYADIDDDFISIHHLLKWYKFGFTRTWDNLALEIRAGRKTRDQAIEFIRNRGDETPHDDIAKFCTFTGITAQHFFEISERFRNLDIWTRENGSWIIKEFLISDWRWL